MSTLYKNEIEEDEKNYSELTKKACKPNMIENEQLHSFYSPMLEPFIEMRK